mmetsp:Transcript_24646/g.55054  ORF Transcript_24646/g.55054 Transcript_24646/m.55054 type:complete len:217 (+) Transcript_24646:511-1161(+)
MKVSGWTPVVRSEHEQQRLSLRAFRERERSETPSLHRVAEPSLFRRSGVCVPSRTTDPVPIVREGCPVADTTAVSRNAARATPRVRGSGRNRANHRVPEPPRGGPIRASFGARCNHGHDPPGLLPPAQQTKRDGAGAVVPWVVVGSGLAAPGIHSTRPQTDPSGFSEAQSWHAFSMPGGPLLHDLPQRATNEHTHGQSKRKLWLCPRIRFDPITPS